MGKPIENNFDYTEKVSVNILKLLMNSMEFRGNSIKLTCGQLDREVYEQVNEIFSRFGGKWNKKLKFHEFPFDPKPLMDNLFRLKLMPPKNPLAFFPTPKSVINRMLEYIILFRDDITVLEPSAGQGNIADELKLFLKEYNPKIDVVEMDKYNQSILKGKKYTLAGYNFLEYKPRKKYDLIVMNPPFAVEGNKRAWVDHIEHAFELLKEGGELIAITPVFDYLTEKKLDNFFYLLGRNNGSVETIKDKPFKESGTDIDVNIVYLRKQTKNEEKSTQEEYNGYSNFWVFEWFLYSDNCYELSREKEELFRNIKINKYSNKDIEDFIQKVKYKARREEDCYMGFNNSDISLIIEEFVGQAREECY